MLTFLLSCHKDENQNVDNGFWKVEGNAVDVRNGEVIQGLSVYAHRVYWVGPWDDTGYWSSKTLDSTTTDENGYFSLEYLKTYNDTDLKIEPSSIPPGYQKIVQVNDTYLCTVTTDGININQSQYTLKCLPRTWVKFNIATVPPVWATDTLFFRIRSLYGDSNSLCGCGEKEFSFAIQNSSELQGFQQQAWEIGYANSVSIDYWVKGSDIKFTNFIRIDCAWGDTTNILIPF